jgi:threonine/homoserine/homoserine lactone efflux protein
MFGTHEFGTFLLASFLLWITPGPDNMYILARSVAQGRRAGILSALGIGAGTVLHTLLAAFGLSALLAASAWAFAAVKIAGACYLICLGVQALRQPITPPAEATPVTPMSGGRIFRQGVVSNALNPKVAVFFLAFLPQFVDPDAGLGPIRFLALGSAFVVGGTAWCVLVAVGAATLSGSVRRHPRAVGWLERAAGCVYIALGLHLLRHKPQPA